MSHHQITENRIQATAGPVVKIAAKANETVVERNKLFYWDNRGLVDLSHRAVVCDNAVVQLLTNRDRVAASSRYCCFCLWNACCVCRAGCVRIL